MFQAILNTIKGKKTHEHIILNHRCCSPHCNSTWCYSPHQKRKETCRRKNLVYHGIDLAGVGRLWEKQFISFVRLYLCVVWCYKEVWALKAFIFFVTHISMHFQEKLERLEELAHQSRAGATLATVKRIDINTRSLATYSECFGLDIARFVAWKRKALDRPVVVADFCPGYGIAMGELQGQLGADVHVIGFDQHLYEGTGVKTEVVANLHDIANSVLPHIPGEMIDLAFSLFGMPMRSGVHLQNENVERGIARNNAFFREVGRLLVPGGEGCFHHIGYVDGAFDLMQQEVDAFLQSRKIMMSEGTIEHVYMRK